MSLRLDFSGYTPSFQPVYQSHIKYAASMSEILLQHSYIGIKRLDLDLSPRIVRETQAPYSPPFTNLPNLEDLTLSESSSHGWATIKLLEIPDGVRIPALRSLTMKVELMDWHLVSGWVVALMARLKQQGDLDKFRLLRIQGLHENNRERSDLEGAIHDYLPEHKIVLDGM